MYIGFKRNILRRYELVWIGCVLDQTCGLWLRDKESTS